MTSGDAGDDAGLDFGVVFRLRACERTATRQSRHHLLRPLRRAAAVSYRQRASLPVAAR